jgi:flavodoxin
MQKTKIAAEELAEMIRDGLAEEGHEVHVHPNPENRLARGPHLRK